MNKVFKVIWSEARNAYVVVSEMAKSHGTKSCSTKKLLAMLIATGVMTCASFDVLAAEPSGTDTAKSQYVAFADPTHTLYSGNKTTIDGHEYIYDAANKYWVRKGYKLVVEENGAMHTPLSDHGKSSDVAYIGNGDKDSILQSVASMVSASGTVTNMGESLNKITASGFVGVSHSGGTAVDGTWHYIIHDPSWKGAVAQGNYEDGYVDLVGSTMPKGFVTADDNKGLKWDDDKQAYNYKGRPVDYSNVYVINGKIGVFTNKDGSDFYDGTVFGKNNEILMTVKDDDGHFYSYWASAVTDPSATMSTYRLAEYKKDLSVLVDNDEKLSRNDIKEVTLDTSKANSATIGLLRNGKTEAGAPVTGAITVTSGGGTEGSDTFVKISNGSTANQTFATGSKVEVTEATAGAGITGIKVNGQEYTINNKVYKAGSNVTIDGDVISATDTTYTEGNGIEIDATKANAISVKLQNNSNLVVDSNGLALNTALTGIESINGTGAGSISFNGGNVKVNQNTFNSDGRIQNVANGTETKDAVNFGQLDATNKKVDNLTTEVGKGWTVATDNGTATKVGAGDTVKFSGADDNIKVSNTGKDVKVELNKNLTVDSVKAGDFFMDKNKGVGYNGKAYITNSGLNANGQTITNVADGVNNNDAVNVGQLNKVSTAAKTEVKAGTNTSVVKTTGDNGQDIYTVNAKDTTYTAGNGISISGENNAIAVNLKEGENNLEVTADGLALKKNLTVDSVKAGDFYMSNAGIGYGEKAYITSSGLNANAQKITNVAAGTADTDAVNYGQLKNISATAKTEVKAGTNITSVEKTTGANGQDIYTVNAKDTTYTAGNGIGISGANNAIAVNLKEGENNLEVTADGLALKKNLTVDSVKAGDFYMSNAGIGYGGKAYITSSGLNANGQRITNVADGVNNTDAVNVSQLKKVSDTANAGWNLSTGKGITSPTKVKSGATVDFSGDDENITVSKEETEFATLVNVKLNRNLNVDSVNAGDYFMSAERGIGFGGSAYITQSGLDANNNVISNVAAGTADTDAVNVSQLKNTVANSGWKLAANGVLTEAKDVKSGEYVDFNGDQNISISNDVKDGIKTVKVELNKDLSGIESISNGDAKMALNGAAGTAGMINGKGASIYMQDGYTVINSKVVFDQTGKISGVAAGAITADSTDAVNGSQLHAVATEAGKHSKVVNGSNINVEETDADGQKFYKVNLNKDIILGDLTGQNVSISGTNSTIESTGYIATKDRVYADKGAKLADIDVTGNIISNGDAKMALDGAAGTAGMINGKGASIYMQDGYTVINSKVAFDQTGKISGVVAGAITADSTDAVNGSQLHAVATEASKHSKVVNGSNINVEETDNDGQKIYKVNLNKDIMLGDLTGKNVSISGTNGTIETTGHIATKDRVYADKGAKLADIDVTGNKISNGASSIVLDGSNVKVNDKVTIDQNGKISGVAAGVADTNAVNVGQLKEAVEAGNTDTHIRPGEYGVGADNTVNMDVVDKNSNKIDTVTIKDVAKASDVGDVNNIADDIKNGEGKTTVVDAVNNLNNKLDTKVGDLQYSKVEKGDIADGDSTTTAIGKLDQKLTDVAATAAKHTTVAAGDNIDVTEDTNKDGGKEYKVALKNNINLGDKGSVKTGQTVMNNDGVKVGDKVSVSATAVTAGQTSISDAGVKVGDNTYISADGLNANNQKVTNVANGKVEKDSKDAINGGQLFDTETKINNRIDGVENQVINNSNRIGQLNSRVNKVGAGAAALAALHPMDFDPDDKLTFSAGYGNYAGQNAAAIGAYYRPDEKVMFSVGGTVGNGENMVNAGVSFALDRTNHVSNSRTALAREVIDLRGQLAVMGAKMAKMEKAFGMLDETKTKLFPDVPANHWAYEYIAKLAGNGYIEGYPDGSFGGDRLMTRYEFAAMLYRAIKKGAALEEKIIKEFEPELGRIRVERISGEDGDRNKIERVRVNDTKGERDHYGNKLAK